jgi:hypothetical protein
MKFCKIFLISLAGILLYPKINLMAFQDKSQQQRNQSIHDSTDKDQKSFKYISQILPYNEIKQDDIIRTSITKIISEAQSETIPVAENHPWAIYFVLIAAGLAAAASLASSTITALVTWKSKDKEYKNDYYKKVIDKRIKAIESAEHLLSLFSSISLITENGEFYHSFFDNYEKYEKWENKIDDVSIFSIWYSEPTLQALMNLTKSVSTILEEIKNVDVKNNNIHDIYISNYALIDNQKKSAETAIGNDMHKLYDVDTFFKLKFKGHKLKQSRSTR